MSQLPLNQLVKKIKEAAREDSASVCALNGQRLLDYLESEALMERLPGTRKRRPTPQGEALGMTLGHFTTEDGATVEQVLYGPGVERFILEHLHDFVAFSRGEHPQREPDAAPITAPPPAEGAAANDASTRRAIPEDDPLRVYVENVLAENAYIPEATYRIRLERSLGYQKGALEHQPLWFQTHWPVLNAYNTAVLAWVDRYFRQEDAGVPNGDQCKLVAVGEDRSLVVAGAGTGKSFSLAQTVKYLTQRGDIPLDDELLAAKDALLELVGAPADSPARDFPSSVPPDQILVFSFNNQAVTDLRDSKFRDLGLRTKHPRDPADGAVTVSTFHAMGLDILRGAGQTYAGVYSDDGLPTSVLEKLFRRYWDDEDWRMKWDRYFYWKDEEDPRNDTHIPVEEALRERAEKAMGSLDDLKKEMYALEKELISLRGERLASQQEFTLANVLTALDVPYLYESVGRDVDGREVLFDSKFYTPDFALLNDRGEIVCYYEHFGVISRETFRRYLAGDTGGLSDTQMHYAQECKSKLSRTVRGREEYCLDEQPGVSDINMVYTWSPDEGELKKGKRPDRLLFEALLALLQSESVPLSFSPPDDCNSFEKYWGRRWLWRKEDLLIARWSERKLRQWAKNFIKPMERFIQTYDGVDTSQERFDLWLGNGPERLTDERDIFCVELYRDCHRWYHDYLQERRLIDFSQMLQDATRRLGQAPDSVPRYRYIFVDEYQDISQSSSEFLQALTKATGAKLIAIGDDWQSIYAFAGARVDLFTNFCDIMGGGDQEAIIFQKTFRNPQSLIDVAGSFIQQNSGQIKKTLKTDDAAAQAIRDTYGGEITDPVVIYTYHVDDIGETNTLWDRLSLRQELEAEAQQETLGKIVRELQRKYPVRPEPYSVLLLGRFQHDLEAVLPCLVTKEGGERISDAKQAAGKVFWYGGKDRDTKQFQFELRTIHGAKGYESDIVILLNGQDDTYGFPSQVWDPDCFELVAPPTDEDSQIGFPEERRLFYVALTRTRSRCYCMAPEGRRSVFLQELCEDYPDQVRVEG